MILLGENAIFFSRPLFRCSGMLDCLPHLFYFSLFFLETFVIVEVPPFGNIATFTKNSFVLSIVNDNISTVHGDLALPNNKM